jgi:Family of unknown function (DUF5631)/Family of unknown function (DUF5632)
MTFPPGEWSLLLVGDQWPDDENLMALSRGKINRGNIKNGFSNFADMLRNSQTGPLAGQQGHTADDLRNAFSQGENQARRVAEKNGTKESAYGTAYDSTLGLQHDLTSLAEDGTKQIKEIQDSKQPVEAKVTQILAVIHQSRALASLAAAKYSGNVLDAIQRVLDEEGTGQSARQFAQAHGIDPGHMFRQPNDQKNLETQVRGMVDKSSPPTFGGGQLATAPKSGDPPAAQVSGTAGSGEVPPGFGGGQIAPAAAGGVAPNPAGAMSGKGGSTFGHGQLAVPPAAGRNLPAPPAGPPLQPGAAPVPTGIAPPAATPSPPSATASASIPGTPFAPVSQVQGLTPGELMHSFDKGMEAGAPLSAAADAVPPSPTSPTEPQAPPTASSAGLDAPVQAPVFDSPPPVTHTPATDAPTAPSLVAGPAAPAGPVAATPPPTGPLPAYASDLRPTIPAATAPAAPPSPPSSAIPGSAPVHPSAGQGSAGQPTVVRQATPPTSPSSASNLGTQAVAATATGAAAGAASANTTARARLERLVSAVARQQPRLAWAAGDRADGTTVLTTDLASGWIPPGIDLPAAVTLLPPERRRGDIETLLGEVAVAVGYTPIHHIPEEDEPVPTSPRPRHVPDIDELGWELNQATQWRDGLPQLAHTLAKAASAGTGVLDKEVELLHEHLAAISTRVLESYPDHMDTDDVGNWQLLAAIDALVAGQKTVANYHLAWFQACKATTGQASQ